MKDSKSELNYTAWLRQQAMRKNDALKDELLRRYGTLPPIAPTPRDPREAFANELAQQIEAHRLLMQQAAISATQKTWQSIYSNVFTGGFAPTDTKPVTPKPIPRELVAGPTLAYRTWGVVDGCLTSVNEPEQVWPTGTPYVAECTSYGRHPAPQSRCSCGVYALKRSEDLSGYASHARVAGQVAMWGRVIEHARGYRAQYAYPVRLFGPVTTVPLPPGFPGVARGQTRLERLAARYGIPVVSRP